MKYLGFTNDGELDIMGLILMGASTKRGDNSKIGEFGTGWKYAIATLLRNQIGIRIFVGHNEIDIDTRKVSLHGDEFDMITVDGKDANFTTELGPQWLVWMAIREIYCNSLDEPHPTTFKCDSFAYDHYIRSGRTAIFIEVTEAVEDVIDEWFKYFCFERTDDIFEIAGELKVYRCLHPNRSIIYRKGIKVAESDKPGCFDYDFNTIPINELRVSDFSYVRSYLKDHLTRNFNSEIINKILQSSDTWERDINFQSWDTISNKEEWKGAIGKKFVVPQEFSSRIDIPMSPKEEDVVQQESETLVLVPTVLAQLILDDPKMDGIQVLGFVSTGKAAIPEVIGEELNKKIHSALMLLDGTGLYDTGEYLIAVCEFSDSWVKSARNNNTINITSKAKEMPITEITLIIAKEILLHKSKQRSCSIQFEDWLIANLVDKLIKLSVAAPGSYKSD